MGALTLLLLTAGCAPSGADDVQADLCDGDGAQRVGLVSGMNFARVTDNATSMGFDLDGLVSDSWDPGGCNIPDYVGFDGREGVDNAIARILPALDATEAIAVEGLVLDAIRSGELLMLPTLDDVDDLRDDPCVDLSLVRGMGIPQLGTDRTVLGGQTLDADPTQPRSEIKGVALVDGVVEAGPVDVQLPLQVLDAELDLHLNGAMMRVELAEDGSMHGWLAGGVPVQAILDVVRNYGVDAGLRDLVESVMGITADLAPDDQGVCQELSVTLEYTAVPAFFFED